MPRTIVAVPTDIRHFEGHTWYATPVQYTEAALASADAMSLLVPALEAPDVDIVLDRVDGVLVGGSRTNVHPSLYGTVATGAHGPFDPARDATSLALIRRAIARGMPLLAICRGIQELNVALGGTLANDIQDLPGRMDHRPPTDDDTDRMFAIRQDVHVKEGSCLAAIVGAGAVRVNSLHRQAIATLAPRLRVEATAEDGTIEAVSVADTPGFAIGVQWHPEYWVKTDVPSAAIFRAFGEATRAYAATKGLRAAAE